MDFVNNREKNIDLSTFNILGLDPTANVTESKKLEMDKIIEEFNSFFVEADRLHEEFLERVLYGDMGKEQAEEILSRYENVNEGYEHITGCFSESEEVIHKRKYLITPILEKLGKLSKFGEKNKIYSNDFILLKKMMLEKLMGLFGSSLDIADFKLTIDELKVIGMIPKEFEYLDMVQYCALGRWY